MNNAKIIKMMCKGLHLLPNLFLGALIGLFSCRSISNLTCLNMKIISSLCLTKKICKLTNSYKMLTTEFECSILIHEYRQLSNTKSTFMFHLNT